MYGLCAGLLQRSGEQRDGLQRLDRLADALGYLARRHTRREQLAGTPVAALSGQRGCYEVPPRRPSRSSTPAALQGPPRSWPHSANMCPAAAPAALRPCASVAPAASAAAFFAAPASSTPIGSLERSQTTPARVKTWASAAASSSSWEAATRPAPACTISCACAGPPTQATRWAPNAALRMLVGGAPSGARGPSWPPGPPRCAGPGRHRAGPRSHGRGSARAPPGRRSPRARRRPRPARPAAAPAAPHPAGTGGSRARSRAGAACSAVRG